MEKGNYYTSVTKDSPEPSLNNLRQELAESQAKYYALLLSNEKQEAPAEILETRESKDEVSERAKKLLFNRLYELSSELVALRTKITEKEGIMNALSSELIRSKVKDHRRKIKSALKRKSKSLGAKKEHLQSPGFEGSFLSSLTSIKDSSTEAMDSTEVIKANLAKDFAELNPIQIEKLKEGGVTKFVDLSDKELSFLESALGGDRPYGWETWIMQADLFAKGLHDELRAFRKSFYTIV